MRDAFIKQGFTLVPLRTNTKKPIDNNWPSKHYDPQDLEAYTNLGLNNELSRTITVDVDDVKAVTPLFRHLGLKPSDFKGRWTAREGRWKCTFLKPDNVDLAVRRDLVYIKDDVAYHPLELRGTGQDVLPGSIHPDTKTPYAYKDDPPEGFTTLPEPLLNLYLNWDEVMPGLVREVYGVEWKPGKERTGEELQGNRAMIVNAFNDMFDVREILEAHGYKGSGDRYLYPGSTSNLPGVVVYDDDSTCYSNHQSGDPLADGNSHDAFDVMRILDYQGHWEYALACAERETGLVPADLAAIDFAEFKEEKPAQAEAFDLFTWDDVSTGEAAPRQLVEDFLLYKNSSLVSAQPNTGKSAFALDLGVHIATGTPWDGRQVEQARVLYVAAESPGSIKTRILAHKASQEVESVPLDVIQERVNLAEPGARSVFKRKLRAYAAVHTDLGIAIVDTFRAATPGVDENTAESISPVVKDLHDLAYELGIHVMIIHHTTKEGSTYSGSGAFGAFVDTELWIVDDEERGCLVGHVKQQRELGAKGDEWLYRIEGVPTGRINNFGSEETAPMVRVLSGMELDLEQAEQETAEAVARAEQDQADLETILEAWRAGHTSKAAQMEATGLPERRVEYLRNLGVENGDLVAVGSGTRTRYELAQ